MKEARGARCQVREGEKERGARRTDRREGRGVR